MPHGMNLWLFGVSFIVALALLSLNTFVGCLAALAWGFVVFPHGAAWLLRRGQPGADPDENVLDLGTTYWRSAGPNTAGR